MGYNINQISGDMYNFLPEDWMSIGLIDGLLEEELKLHKKLKAVENQIEKLINNSKIHFEGA